MLIPAVYKSPFSFFPFFFLIPPASESLRILPCALRRKRVVHSYTLDNSHNLIDWDLKSRTHMVDASGCDAWVRMCTHIFTTQSCVSQ